MWRCVRDKGERRLCLLRVTLQSRECFVRSTRVNSIPRQLT
jgi:hypothetical protein